MVGLPPRANLGVQVYGVESEWKAYESGVLVEAVGMEVDGMALGKSNRCVLVIIPVLLTIGLMSTGCTLRRRAKLPLFGQETLLCTLEGDQRKVIDIAFNHDGTIIASGAGNGVVSLWQVADGVLLNEIVHPDAVNSVSFSPDGSIIASGASDGKVRLWRVTDGELISTLDHRGVVSSVAFAPDGNTLASGSSIGTVWLRRVSDGKYLGEYAEVGIDPVVDIAFTPDGDTLVAASQAAVRLWRVSDGALLHTLGGYKEPIASVDISPGGDIVATGSWDEMIKLWQVTDGTLLREWQDLSGPVLAIAFSPDGAILASGNGMVQLWRVTDGELLRIQSGHKDPQVQSIAFSPDGAILASGTFDGILWLWEAPQ
jgi:WD40 repeat protein